MLYGKNILINVCLMLCGGNLRPKSTDHYQITAKKAQINKVFKVFGLWKTASTTDLFANMAPDKRISLYEERARVFVVLLGPSSPLAAPPPPTLRTLIELPAVFVERLLRLPPHRLLLIEPTICATTRGSAPPRVLTFYPLWGWILKQNNKFGVIYVLW